MKLSIVIPHHNGKKLIFECLESLFRNTSIQNFETIVVDNLSTDNSADQAKENFPQIKLLKADSDLFIETKINKFFDKYNINPLTNSESFFDKWKQKMR